MPDYYNTFFRNYDPALGRFVSLDPDAESAADMTGYQYAANNPVLFNDPLGDRWLQSDDDALIFGRDIGGGRHNEQVAGLVDNIVGGAWAQSEWYFQESLKQAALGGNSYVLKNYFGSTSYKWNPFGGGDITEDEWVAQGGDRSRIDRNKGASFSAGAWKKVGESPGNGGPGSEVLVGFYNSKYIASDIPFGEKLGIDGAFVGNVSGLGFIVKYTTSNGLMREFPVNFNTANFTIPAYGKIKDKYAASALFVLAYNAAVRESEIAIKTALDFAPEKFINPASVRIGFIGFVNANLNAVQLGSVFSGGGYASGNIPTTPAQWLFQ